MATAAERHFEQVIEDERHRGVSLVNKVRLGAAAAAFFLMVPLVVMDRASAAALRLITLYLVIAIALFVVGKRFLASAGSWLGLAVAVFDIPAVALIQRVSWDQTVNNPFILGPVPGMVCGLIVASSLMLSSRVAIAAGISAILSQTWLFLAAEAPIEEPFFNAISPFATAAMSIFLVSRIRRLVIQSRKDDLLGKYILGERIGAGGMAEVFKATYSPEGGFERVVAVKRILASHAMDPDFIARFRREAELTAQLVHPNIAQVLDFGRYGETYFLAMEFVDGVPMSRLPKGEMPLSAVTYLALQLCEALEYIHNRAGPDGKPMGLVHRDLNPPNILLSCMGEVKVADFGVAHESSSAQRTRPGAVVGKVAYLSPEQARGESYDSRADLFALGLTLYETISGDRALRGPTEADVLRSLLFEPIPSLAEKCPDLPPPLTDIVMGLLARDPITRTPTAETVKERLLALPPSCSPFPEGQNLLARQVVKASKTAPAAGAIADATVTVARAVTEPL